MDDMQERTDQELNQALPEDEREDVLLDGEPRDEELQDSAPAQDAEPEPEPIPEPSPEPQPTDEDFARWEKERKQRETAMLKPYKDAAKERKKAAALSTDNADISAQHDDLLAELYYEMTMMELEA